MAVHRNETFTGQRVPLDGNHYEGCTFRGCTLVFRGTGLPTLRGNVFDECQWVFEGAAERTIHFLKGMYHGMGAGGVRVIEDTINDIRTAQTESDAPGPGIFQA